MNSYLPQSLAWDHIRESRQHAAAARKASAVRSTRRRSGTHARRVGHRLARGA
ncbi:MAG: hypothetical protein WAL72_23595 [Streptosporangiaceae bacterium]